MDQAERLAAALNKAIAEELESEPLSMQELCAATLGVFTAYTSTVENALEQRQLLRDAVRLLEDEMDMIAPPAREMS